MAGVRNQEKYRKKHLDRADINFADVEECIYVIDIQDQDSFIDSFNYLKIIRTALLEYAPLAKITFLIHKFDPDLESSKNFCSLAETTEKKLMEMRVFIGCFPRRR